MKDNQLDVLIRRRYVIDGSEERVEIAEAIFKEDLADAEDTLDELIEISTYEPRRTTDGCTTWNKLEYATNPAEIYVAGINHAAAMLEEVYEGQSDSELVMTEILDAIAAEATHMENIYKIDREMTAADKANNLPTK